MFLFQSVTSVTIDVPGDVLLSRVKLFLQRLLWEDLITNSEGKVLDVWRLKVTLEMLILHST